MMGEPAAGNEVSILLLLDYNFAPFHSQYSSFYDLNMSKVRERENTYQNWHSYNWNIANHQELALLSL